MHGRFKVLWLAACLLPLLGLGACGANSNPDFTLTVNAPAITLTQGSATGSANPVIFTVAAVSGSHGSIQLSLSGLPDGVGVAPSLATVGIGSTQTFVLTAANSATVTTMPATITATGTSGFVSDTNLITHTASFALSVAAAPPPATGSGAQ